MRTRMARPWAALAVVALLQACGGSGGDSASDEPHAGDGGTTSSSSAVTTPGGAQGPTGSTVPGAPGSPTGSGSVPGGGGPGQPNAGGTQGPAPLAITAEVALACVRPGATQTITINTLPGAAVGYGAVYADGKSGMSEGYYGGNKGGQVDGTGTWRDTWTIAANAPEGPVRVDVSGAHGNGSLGTTTTSFKMSNALGTCT